jgi:hypothetical protein
MLIKATKAQIGTVSIKMHANKPTTELIESMLLIKRIRVEIDASHRDIGNEETNE